MAVICAVTFMGCEKDEQESFKFDIENLYGTWQGIAIQSNGEWIRYNPTATHKSCILCCIL